eukprot:4608644-Lingulodinium_polyedra.AAC.1
MAAFWSLAAQDLGTPAAVLEQLEQHADRFGEPTVEEAQSQKEADKAFKKAQGRNNAIKKRVAHAKKA